MPGQLQLFDFGRGGEMCVGGGFLGILRVGEAIWGRGEHDFLFYFSLGSGGGGVLWGSK